MNVAATTTVFLVWPAMFRDTIDSVVVCAAKKDMQM